MPTKTGFMITCWINITFYGITLGLNLHVIKKLHKSETN